MTDGVTGRSKAMILVASHTVSTKGGVASIQTTTAARGRYGVAK
ncbi:hypothetical protein EMIT0P228_20072 [Pseudomonas brassicacearum]